MAFVVHAPDYTLSPYTGMTRRHWLEAGELLLGGIFANVPTPESPIVLKRHEHAITYPRPGDSRWRMVAEKFEGLARSFLISGPLLAHNPQLTVCGIGLRDYYQSQTLLLAEEGSELYIGDLDDMVRQSGSNALFQHTCECASLVINLQLTRKSIWDTYTRIEQDRIAQVLSRWGHYLTAAQNWRLFNILILTFLKINGYPIDQALLTDHLQHTLSFYCSDGWYRDGGLFDYYSSWAFQFYAPIWCQWYGHEQMPVFAEALERHSNELMRTYDRFFDAQGKMALWGRSGIYRFGASAPFGANFLLKHPAANPGLARRILSGNLMQFIGREEVFQDGQLGIGFYGPFSPMVQHYSCAASPYWAANSFHALSLGEDHPLWQAKEENGIWDTLADRALTTTLPGPGISVVNYGKSGMTEFRTSRLAMAPTQSWLQNYSRLAFSTELPWEQNSTLQPDSMHLSLSCRGKKLAPNLILFGGQIDDVFYRRLVYDFSGDLNHNVIFIDMAEYAYAEGILRFDRLHLAEAPYTLTLCHYGLPCLTPPRLAQVQEGRRQPIPTAAPAESQLSMECQCGLSITASTEQFSLGIAPLLGWSQMGAIYKQGMNPIAASSVVLNASLSGNRYYRGMPFLVTALSHCRHGKLTYEQTNPVSELLIREVSSEGSPWGAEVMLRNGERFSVDFGKVDGRYGI